MTDTVEIMAVRHGQTFWNAERRVQGHSDAELNPEGLAQADQLAERLQHESFDAIYSSDLKRAMRTVLPVSEKLGLPIHQDTGLREWNLGDWEGMLVDDVKVRFKESYAAYKNVELDYQVPGGESFRAFSMRTIGAIEAIARAHHGQRLMALTHGGVVISWLRHALKIPESSPKRWYVPNTACTVFVLSNLNSDQPNWKLVRSDVDVDQ